METPDSHGTKLKASTSDGTDLVLIFKRLEGASFA